MKKYKGIKYNKITLQTYAHPGGHGVGEVWWGKCDCGNRRTFIARQVANGRITTCGECIEHRKLAQSARELKHQLRQLMANATKWAFDNNYTWALSIPEFNALIVGGCYFCKQPTARYIAPKHESTHLTPDTAVAECPSCRKRRRGLNATKYLEYCRAVVQNRP